MASCRNNLKQIAFACNIYSQNYNGSFPVSLQQLVPDYIADERLFICQGDPLSEDAMSYVYLPGHTYGNDEGVILVFDEFGNHSGKWRCVVYTDGRVDTMSEEKFIELAENEMSGDRMESYSSEALSVLAGIREGKRVPKESSKAIFLRDNKIFILRGFWTLYFLMIFVIFTVMFRRGNNETQDSKTAA